MQRVIKVTKVFTEILTEVTGHVFSLVWGILESAASASRACVRLLFWISDQVQAVLAMFILMAVLMIPFPISIARHYQQLSPVEKYWFTTYLRTEFSPWSGGIYRVLVVDDAKHNLELVTSENVAPGQTMTTEGDDVPFVLIAKEQQMGKRLVLLPPAVEDNNRFWGDLYEKVYHSQTITEMGQTGLRLGFLLNFLAVGTLGLVSALGLIFRICTWIFWIWNWTGHATKSVLGYVREKSMDARLYLADRKESRKRFRELEKRIYARRNSDK